MSFLNQLRANQLPPIKNVLNVAWQTAKQQLPDKNKKGYEEPAGSSNDMGGSSQQPPVPPRPQNVRFAEADGGKCEINTIS